MFKNIEKKYFWYLSIRFLIVLTLPILGIFSTVRGFKVNLVPHFVILFLTISFSLFLTFLLKNKKFYTFYNYVQIIYDNLLIFSLVYFTGGSNNFFEILYFVNIIAASFFLLAKGSFLSAVLSTIAYSIFVFGEHFEFIISPYRALPQPYVDLEVVIIKAYIYTLSFFLVAALSGFLSEKLQARKLELFKYSAKIKDLLDHIPNIIILLDQNFKVTDYNKNSYKLFPMIKTYSSFKDVDKEIFKYIEKNENTTFKRNERDYQLQVYKIFNQQSKENFIMVVINDITEIVEYEKKLNIKEKLETIGELSASLAHEIRNPLSNIKESSKILYEELKEGHKDHPMFNLLFDEIDRLNKLVNKFLKYAKIGNANFETIKLNDFKEELYLIDPKYKNVLFDNFGGVTLVAEKNSLKEIFINLIENSFDAIKNKEDGVVRVIYERDKNFDILRFIDNGIGIDEKLKNRLFQPFTTNKEKGIGLGLSIVYRIIKDEYKGEIDFESKEGLTEFVLKFRRNL